MSPLRKFRCHADVVRQIPSYAALYALVLLAGAAIAMPASRVAHRSAPSEKAKGMRSYVGFDRNDYPGDSAMAELKRIFAFTGYWVVPPPGESNNSWTGKRDVLRGMGYGFLVLFQPNAKNPPGVIENANGMGMRDAARAIAGAMDNGFPRGTVIFLDLEQGGRLPPQQLFYALAWIDAVNASRFRAGVYCSGISLNEGGSSVITAEDLREQAAGRKIVYWVFNDMCPPAPGCAVSNPPPMMSASGVPFADVWQYAQTPEERDRTARCAATYGADGKCYAPGRAASGAFLDLDVADSPDPSRGR